MNDMSNTPSVDISKRIAQYVQLRDIIKAKEEAHKNELKPAKELLEKLNGVLLNHLNQLNIDNVSSGAGTVYRTERKSVSAADPAIFRDFIIANDMYDLADIKPNQTAVSDFLDTHGALPPGVNYSVTYVVGVRRGAESGAAPGKTATAPSPEGDTAAPRSRRRKRGETATPDAATETAA
mgnify:CR=1 FL=1